MLKTTKNILAALVLALIFVPPTFAQQPAAGAQNSESEYVTEKGFKSKVFEVKYRDPTSLAKALQQLGSGFKGATIWASTEFKTITVRDFPENLATIEEALKRLDAPAVPRPNIELHMHVLIASNTSTSTGGATAQVPAELRDVLTQLRETLSYRNYELATSVIQRLTETRSGLRGKGIAEVPGAQPATPHIFLPYEYSINIVSLVQNPTGAATVQINEFSFATSSDRTSAQVQTSLNLRDGEKVVVGTATLRDRALIIVLTAKVIN